MIYILFSMLNQQQNNGPVVTESSLINFTYYSWSPIVVGRAFTLSVAYSSK